MAAENACNRNWPWLVRRKPFGSPGGNILWLPFRCVPLVAFLLLGVAGDMLLARSAPCSRRAAADPFVPTTHSIVRRVPFFRSAFVIVNSSPLAIPASSIFFLTMGGTYITRPSVSVYSTWSAILPSHFFSIVVLQCDFDWGIRSKLNLFSHFSLQQICPSLVSLGSNSIIRLCCAKHSGADEEAFLRVAQKLRRAAIARQECQLRRASVAHLLFARIRGPTSTAVPTPLHDQVQRFLRNREFEM
jgi:hypothetical protein